MAIFGSLVDGGQETVGDELMMVHGELVHLALYHLAFFSTCAFYLFTLLLVDNIFWPYNIFIQMKNVLY